MVFGIECHAVVAFAFADGIPSHHRVGRWIGDP
jgi:hypothetical protein